MQDYVRFCDINTATWVTVTIVLHCSMVDNFLKLHSVLFGREPSTVELGIVSGLLRHVANHYRRCHTEAGLAM
jgi:hypothetical protein